MLNHPASNIEDINSRQSVMNALLDINCDLEKLSNVAWEWSYLADSYDSLFKISDEEERRVENLRGHGKYEDARSKFEILFWGTNWFEPVKQAVEMLRKNKELNHDDLDKILNTAGWEEKEWENNPWDRVRIWDQLFWLVNNKEEIFNLVKLLKDIPEPNIQKIAIAIEKEAKELPDYNWEKIYNAWKDDDEQTLGELWQKASSMAAHLDKVISLFTIALHFKEEQFSPATFDKDKPEFFKEWWNFSKKKEYIPFSFSRDKNKKKWWKQIPNSSPKHTPLTILCWSNMSWKSFYLEKVLNLHLCAQAFWYIPALEWNFHCYDSFIHLDRSNTDSDNNLSAFWKEVDNWRKVFESIWNSSSPFVLADESYSTTSPIDQHKLWMATINHLLWLWARIYLSNHNEWLLKECDSISDAEIYHFETWIGSNGDIDFLYNMKPWIDESHSFEVARRLKLSSRVIQSAKSYAEWKPQKVESQNTIINVVSEYSSIERETLKKERVGIIGFTRGDNEFVVLDGFEPPNRWWNEDKKISDPDYYLKTRSESSWDRYNDYMKKPHLCLRYGRSGQWFDDQMPSLHEKWLPEWNNILDAITDSSDLRFWRFWALKDIIDFWVPNSSEELIERQRLFELLPSLEINVNIVMHKCLSLLKAVSWFIPWYYGWGDKIPWYEPKQFFKICIGKIAWKDKWMWDSSSWVEFLKEIIVQIEGIFDLSDDKEWGKLNEQLALLLRWDEIRKENPDQNRFNLKHGNKEYIEWIKECKTIFWQEKEYDFKDGKALESIFKQYEDLIPDHDLTDFDFNELSLKFSNSIDTFIRLSNNRWIDWAPWRLWCVLYSLLWKEHPTAWLTEELRRHDSVYTNQWANYLDDVLGHVFDWLPFWADLFKEFITTPDVEKLRGLKPSYYSNAVARDLNAISTIQRAANWMKDQWFCKVEFNEESNVSIEDWWNLTEIKNNQVQNSSIINWSHRINLLTWSNMSWKTYNLKQNILAVLCAQTLWLAPAKSMSCPLYDGIVYLDRVNTNQKEWLSSFWNEIHHWVKLLDRVKNKENLFIAVDEAFSTTSPFYQSALSYGLCHYLAEKWVTLTLSSHNHEFIETFLRQNPNIAKAWHFHAEINNDSWEVKFTYHKKEGHWESYAIAVARHLWMPDEIIQFANLMS